VALATPAGTAAILAVLPVTAALAGLLATSSRGALGALVAAAALATARGRRRAAAVVLVAVVPLLWLGADFVRPRLSRLEADTPARTAVWEDVLGRMPGLWLSGTGFNTFGAAMSRVRPWRLPAGATPWTTREQEQLLLASRIGYRTPPGVPGVSWYREAHNDYVQVLVECGIPGLLVALWAAAAALRHARHDGWVLAALLALLLHEAVDFDLQIPAVAVLFVTVASLAEAGGRRAEA
jgi:O-antigen ligase